MRGKDEKAKSQLYNALFRVTESLNLSIDFASSLDSFARIIVSSLKMERLGIIQTEGIESDFSLLASYRMNRSILSKIRTQLTREFQKFLTLPEQDGLPDFFSTSYLLNFTENRRKKYLFFIPLKAHRRYQGLLIMTKDQEHLESYSYDLDFLSIIGSQLATFIERYKLLKKLEEDAREFGALYEISRSINSSFDERTILSRAFTKLNELNPDCLCGYFDLTDELKPYLFLSSRFPVSPASIDHLVKKVIQTANSELNLNRKIFRSRVERIIEIKTENTVEMGRSPRFKNFLFQSVKICDRKCGLFFIASRAKRNFSRQQQELFTTISFHIANTLENAKMFKKNRELAFTDPVTNLFNHRYFQETLDRELERSQRYDSPLSLMIIDIDHFKNFNDTYGHPQGDRVLKLLATLLQENSRTVDTVARYGGEEFVIILPETSKSGTIKQAERIRAQIEKFPFKLKKGKVKVTVSIGVANFPEDNIKDKKSLIEKADIALYRAKAAGRNRVCVSGPEHEPLKVLEGKPVF